MLKGNKNYAKALADMLSAKPIVVDKYNGSVSEYIENITEGFCMYILDIKKVDVGMMFNGNLLSVTQYTDDAEIKLCDIQIESINYSKSKIRMSINGYYGENDILKDMDIIISK